MAPILALYAAAAAVTAPLVSAFTPNLFFNLTLDAISPVMRSVARQDGKGGMSKSGIVYNSDATSWWNVTYSDSPNEALYEVGKGQPQRIGTIASGGSVSIGDYVLEQIPVKAAYVYGAVDGYDRKNMEYKLELGPGNLTRMQPGTNGLLGSTFADNYQAQRFSCSLFVNKNKNGAVAPPRARLIIDRVDLTVGMQSEAESIDKVPSRVEPFVLDGKPNPFYSLPKGQWKPSDELENTLVGAPYDPSDTKAGGTSSPKIVDPTVQIRVPDGTAFLVVRGMTHANSSHLKFAITPPPPTQGWIIVQSTDGQEYVYSSYALDNGLWTGGPTVFHYEALDPTIQYKLRLHSEAPNTDSSRRDGPPRQNYLFLTDMIFYAASKDTPPQGGGPYVDETVPDGIVANGALRGVTPALPGWAVAVVVVCALGVFI